MSDLEAALGTDARQTEALITNRPTAGQIERLIAHFAPIRRGHAGGADVGARKVGPLLRVPGGSRAERRRGLAKR